MNSITTNQFASINSSLFVEGMRLRSGLYYKYRNEYVLLCRNVTLDHELITKIRQFSREGRSVYVEKIDYKQVFHDGLRYRKDIGLDPPINHKGNPYTQEELKTAIAVEKGYNSITADTESILQVLADSGKISMEASNKVFESMQNKLLNVDEAALVQCINTIREGDYYLYTHCVDVAILNGLIGRWMKLSPEEVRILIRTGYFHDLGKVRIDPEILNKPAALTSEEFEIIKQHTLETHKILLHSGEKDPRVLLGARSHHERNNGRGYPDGLTQNQIHLFARITAVSDVYSAMVSRRVYKPQNSPFDILEAFYLDRFSDLDYTIISVFIEHMPHELVGKLVLLSNGETAKVIHVPWNNLAHPIVMTRAGPIETTQKLHCVSMTNPLSIFVEQPFLDAQKDIMPFDG